MIYIRGNKHCVVVYDRGLRRKRWVGSFPDRSSAEAAERRETLSRSPRYGQDTADSFAERWADDYPRPAISTNKTNRSMVRPFAKKFSGIRLIDLVWPEVRAWARTQSYPRNQILRNMFNDAIDDRLYLDANPFANLRQPIPRGRKDLEVMTEEEFNELCECAEKALGDYGSYMFRPLIEFAAYTICRPGELYFIERTDIRGNEVYILDADDSTGNPKDPKGGNKRRIILPLPAAEAISGIPARLDAPWLFYTVTGKQFNKSNLHYYWRQVVARFGRPGMDFYEIKHYGASFMVNTLGADPEVVAVQAGHGDHGELIKEVYGHPSEELARQDLRRRFQQYFRDGELPQGRWQ